MQIQTQVDIARNPADVFGALIDQATWKEVDSALVNFSPPGQLAIGLHGTLTHRRAGMRVTTSWQIIEFVPGASLEVLIVGRGYEMREKAILTRDPVGTSVTFIDVLRPTSFSGRVLVAISGRTLRSDLKKRSRKLKVLLEAGTHE